MLEVLLIRHGQTEWNAKRQVMGRRPIPLNAAGRTQAEGVARHLASATIDRLYTSPVARARETAEIIAAVHTGLAVEDCEAFTEIDYGEWTNCGFDDLPVQYAEAWKAYRADPSQSIFPGGESMGGAAQRIHDGVDQIVNAQREGRVAIVSHADVLKVALMHLLGMELKQMSRFAVDNCAILIVRLHGEGCPKLVLANQLNGFGNDMRISELVRAK